MQWRHWTCHTPHYLRACRHIRKSKQVKHVAPPQGRFLEKSTIILQPAARYFQLQASIQVRSSVSNRPYMIHIYIHTTVSMNLDV